MRSRGGSASIEELEEDVAELMKLPEALLAIPHKNGPRSQFGYELAWVRTYLKKAGLPENSERGVWSLTELGEKISDAELLIVPKKVERAEKAERSTIGPPAPNNRSRRCSGPAPLDQGIAQAGEPAGLDRFQAGAFEVASGRSRCGSPGTR